MKKIFTFFAAIVSLNMLMPQKASAQDLPNIWKDGICYYLLYYKNDNFSASVTGFAEESAGHIVVPDTLEYNWTGYPSKWPVKGVSTKALSNESNITSLDLPAGIYNVNDDSFSRSEKLTSIICRAVVPPVVYDRVFNEVSDCKLFKLLPGKMKVYVPEGSVQAYKDDSNWGKATILPLSEYQGVEEVPSDQVPSTKVLRNGVLLIERNGKSYNAQGVEVPLAR